MSADKNWQFEFEEYIKQGEPWRSEKSEAWRTAIGYQSYSIFYDQVHENFWIQGE